MVRHARVRPVVPERDRDRQSEDDPVVAGDLGDQVGGLGRLAPPLSGVFNGRPGKNPRAADDSRFKCAGVHGFPLGVGPTTWRVDRITMRSWQLYIITKNKHKVNGYDITPQGDHCFICALLAILPTMYHYRKTNLSYRKLSGVDRRRGLCPFCNNESGIDKAIYSNDLIYVIPNRTKYDIFEGREVTEHYMIIPRRHVETMDELSDDERLAIMKVASDYEKQGFNVYARGVGSITRSVKHQHTHLIKITNKPTKLYLYLKKPYFVVHK